MDINYDSDEIIKKCFKCNEHVICNLNVVNNASNTTFILWNTFQIFVYEGLDFECASKVIVPEFQIHTLITYSNYLMCLDCTGNVHTTPLKFKNVSQKIFKYGFQPRDSNIVTCSVFSEENALCLKYESEMYFLSVHKINTEFTLVKRAMLTSDDRLPLQQKREKYLLQTYLISETHLSIVKKVFNCEDVCMRNNYSVIIVTFDKLTVYSCLFSVKMTDSEVHLVKLYTCPSEIASIDFVDYTEDLNIVIGLSMGTLIVLNLGDIKSPEIIHLNTNIYKLLAFKDTLLYADGITLWKAEKLLSKNVIISQFFVKDVKDFIKFGDQIICTTYKDLVYTFSFDDERSYVQPQSIDEYCSAEKLLNNSEYLEDIMNEVKKIETLIELQTRERNYITALSLSNRQDIMDEIITYKVIVYESYVDAVSENTDVLLTNNFSEYFNADSFYFLIKLNTAAEHRLDEILSSSLGDLRFHVTITSKGRIIKTTTVKIIDVLKKVTLLLPLKTKFINTTEMRVHMKIMIKIPGALDPKQKIWTVLYRKTVTLNSEHFIKFNLKTNNIICLKEPKESLEKQILQIAINQYGSFFYFTDETEHRPELRKCHMYVRLPDQYAEVFKNVNKVRQFTSKKVNYFLHQFTSEDFLKSKSSLSMSIANEKVNIEIDNDGFSSPTLRVSSHNAKIALDIRNFLSNLIYCVFVTYEPGKEFISHSFYITVENLQKAVRECITSASEEDILPLIEQFERKIIGCLPI